MSKKRKIFSILNRNKAKGEQGESENQEKVKLKNKTKQSGVLGIVEGILNKGKKNANRYERKEDESLDQNETSTQNEIQEPELDPKLIQEIERQVKLALGSLDDDVEIYREEIDLVTLIISKLYTTKKRIQDCIEIANYLHFDKERIDSFLANFDKLKKDDLFSKFAIDGNVKLLLVFYGPIEGLNHLPNERFELTIEEINAIVDAAKDFNTLIAVYEMFMYMKHEERNNLGYLKQETLVANTALEQLKYLRKRQEIYQCTLEKAWHVFGINVDLNPNENLPRTFSFSGLVKQLMKDYENNFSGNLMSSEIETRRTTNEERESETLGLNSKISEFIRNKQRPSLRDYSYTVSGIQTSLKFRKSEIDEFETAIRNWAKSNMMMKIRPITVIDIEKVYHFFTEQTGQYKNTLTQMKYRDAVKDNRIVSNVKNHPKRTAIISLVGLGGVVLVVNTGHNIIRNVNDKKVQGTESTIKMGATTVPGTIEPGFLESLYKDAEEIPVNTTAIIYPNGNVQLVTENGIKEITHTQAMKYQIDEVKMGVTDSNAEIVLKDKEGTPLKNKNDEQVVLYKNSEVIILGKEKNKYYVLETKTGKQGYVFEGDVVEKTIYPQEFEIGGNNPTCCIIKTDDIVYIRETPSAGKDYKGNIKGAIGHSGHKNKQIDYYLAIEDEEHEGFLKLPTFGDESAYIPKDEVEIAYIVQSDGLKEPEKEPDEQEKYNYDDNTDPEIAENKFAIGYTTKTHTIENGVIFRENIEIPEGSYVIETSEYTIVLTSDGKVHKIDGSLEDKDSDKAQLGIQYLRVGTVSGKGEGVPLLNKDGQIKQDKQGKNIMLSELETVVVSPKERVNDRFHIMRMDGTTGYTPLITALTPLENDMEQTQIITTDKYVPLLTTPYYAPKTDYTDNHFTNKKGEEVLLQPGKQYTVQYDEETGFYIVTDNQFTYPGTLYIPEEEIANIYTVTKEGVEKDELVHEDSIEEDEEER